MPDVQAQAPRCPVQVLTTAFRIQGTMEPIGAIVNDLNDANRQHVQMLHLDQP